MLNSCYERVSGCRTRFYHCRRSGCREAWNGGVVSYLLNSHYNLHCVQAVQTQVVGEVRCLGNLSNMSRLGLGRRLTGGETSETHVIRVVDLLREMSASAQDTTQALHCKSTTRTTWMLKQHGHGSTKSHPFTVPTGGEHPVPSRVATTNAPCRSQRGET